jgi:transmembrane sensor
MTLDPDSEARRQIAERAALWLLTLQSEEVAQAQRAEFVDWLRASPLHVSELLRICKLQRELTDFTGWQQMAAISGAQPTEVVRFLPSAGMGRAHRSVRRARNAALLAAGVAALGMTASLIFTRLGQTEFRTQLGERREVTLADESVVDLTPDSDVIVRYKPGERLITLARGEALFRVAKNPKRPFIVQAAQTRVRAVGTVFNVGRGAEGVSVTVVEGRVAVSQQPATRFAGFTSAPASPVLSLQANEQVKITLAGVASEVRKVNGEAEVGAAGELAFENETVGEIARRFNLHNNTTIEILDSRLAARRISGVFRDSDPQSFVSFIQAAANATVSQRDPTHVVLASPGGADGDASR